MVTKEMLKRNGARHTYCAIACPGGKGKVKHTALCDDFTRVVLVTNELTKKKVALNLNKKDNFRRLVSPQRRKNA